MNTWHFFDAGTGLIDPGRSFTGRAADAPLNAPPGHLPVAGVSDALSQRVDLATGALVDWQPPAPAATEWATWSWHAESRRWQAVPTLAAHGRDARAERDRRLSACDWVTARALDLAQPVPAAWAAYRQALRDLPAQAGWPLDPPWPTPPET